MAWWGLQVRIQQMLSGAEWIEKTQQMRGNGDDYSPDRKAMKGKQQMLTLYAMGDPWVQAVGTRRHQHLQGPTKLLISALTAPRAHCCCVTARHKCEQLLAEMETTATISDPSSP